MKDFLDDPRVNEALDRLTQALNAATGGTLKNMMLLAMTAETTAVAYDGCKCPACAIALLTVAGHCLSGRDPAIVAVPRDADTKGKVH